MNIKRQILSGVVLVGLMAVARILPIPGIQSDSARVTTGKIMAQFLPFYESKPKSERNLQSIHANVLEVGKDEYKISQAFFNEQLGDIKNLMKTTRLIPAVEVSSMKGFAIQSIEKDSVFAQLGLTSDDIIREVNGVELNSLAKGQEAFEALKQSKRIELTVKRGEQIRKIAYEVK